MWSAREEGQLGALCLGLDCPVSTWLHSKLKPIEIEIPIEFFLFLIGEQLLSMLC